MEQKNKGLSLFEAAGYGVCSMGALRFQSSFVAYQLLAFLTNVTGFSTVVAASIYSFVNLIKIVTMALSGTLVDGVTFKSGKFRTWCLIGGFVSVLSSFLFFKFNVPQLAYVIIFVGLFIVNQLGYNFIWTSSRALVGPMSSSSADSMKLATAAQIGGSAAGIIYGMVAMPLMAASPESQPYFLPMMVFTLITLAGAIGLYFMAKKYEVGTESVSAPKQQKVSFVEMLQCLKGQGWIFLVATIFGNIQTGFFSTLLYYFSSYVLKNPSIYSLAVTSASVGNFVGAFFAPAICAKFSKKTVYQWSHFISAALYVLLYFFGRSAIPFLVIRVAISLAGTFAGVTLPALCNDLADYNEMMNISHARGFIQSLLGLSIRIGSLISTSASAYGLVLIGFDIKEIAANGVSDAVANGIMTLLGICPAVVCIICGVFIIFYKVDEKVLDEYRANKAK